MGSSNLRSDSELGKNRSNGRGCESGWHSFRKLHGTRLEDSMNVRGHPNQEGYIIEVDGREYASPPGDVYYKEANKAFNSPKVEDVIDAVVVTESEPIKG